MKIIILSGKARSGKNVVSELLEEKLIEKEKNATSISYAFYLKIYAKKIIKWDLSEDTKPRSFLQSIGDLVKDIDNNFLIRRLLEDIEVYNNYYDTLIITDARFKNEIEEIKKRYDTVVINVFRNNSDLTETQKSHNTETSLDDYNEYDYVIDNNGTLEELKEKIDRIVEDIKW